MKKLRLNNIFHWLYAFLMFLPFILLVGDIVSHFGVPLAEDANFYSRFYDIIDDCCNVFVFHPLLDVFNWLDEFLGASWNFPLLFVYWICVSLYWLCFDVLMFLINLAHRWIDRGTDL